MEASEQRLDEQQLRAKSTAELVRHAVEESRLLVKAEVLHAKEEMRAELRAAKRGAILAGVAVTAALCGLSVLLVALALVLPMAEALAALIVGLVLLFAAGLGAFLAYKSVPRKPLARTQERLKKDFLFAREQFQ